MKRISQLIILFLLLSSNAMALVPLESMVLGDFSDKYNKDIGALDPVNYIFQEAKKGKGEEKRNISLFRGFVNEGMNLKNKCETAAKVSYPTYLQEEVVKMSTVATLQYMGIDLTTRALALYGKHFDFTQDEYQNLIDNLTGNYCSNNLSVISIKHLKKNMMALFNSDNVGLELPSIKGNSLFPQELLKMNLIDTTREQEFAITAKLFRAFCSWGGSTHNLGLMVPLLKDPTIMSFVARTASGKKLNWDKFENLIYKTQENNGVSVYCENLICRRQNLDDFKINFPKSMGHKSIMDDIERGYCTYFKNAEYTTKDQVPTLSKIIAKQTLDEDNFLVGQFIALVSGIPDFFIGLSDWEQGKKLVRSSVDRSWNEWADKRNNEFSKNLFFEEQLTIEKVDRRQFFYYRKPKFQVQLDVNMGETDRINQIVGKVSASFYLKISKNLLGQIRKEWALASFKTKEQQAAIVDLLESHIKDQINGINKKFSTPLWRGNMVRLITKEIMEQLVLYEGTYFKFSSRDKVSIPIKFNFAPFALKYMNYKYQLIQNTESAKDVEKTFESKYFTD